jgi:hypothetical protein
MRSRAATLGYGSANSSLPVDAGSQLVRIYDPNRAVENLDVGP